MERSDCGDDDDVVAVAVAVVVVVEDVRNRAQVIIHPLLRLP